VFASGQRYILLTRAVTVYVFCPQVHGLWTGDPAPPGWYGRQRA